MEFISTAILSPESPSAGSDGGHQPAAARPFFTVAEQAIDVTRRTEFRDKNVFHRNPGFDELRPICLLQIEQHFVRAAVGGQAASC